MTKKRGSLFSVLLVPALIAGLIPAPLAIADETGRSEDKSAVVSDEADLSDDQRNAMAMLNHIAVLTQEVNESKNSRVFMEEAYSSLINNTNPNSVDRMTLSKMLNLLDTMEEYRMISVKRERLKYIYDQNQAQAIRAAVPNPAGLVSAVVSCDPVKLVASIAYMAVDSYTSYTAYMAEAEQKFMEDNWELDDEEAKALHESRKDAFAYMVDIVDEYDLPGDLALTEDAVKEFVKYVNSDNSASKIQFLESNGDTYKSYGGYYLELADAYYKSSEYSKCLKAIADYEAMEAPILRHDQSYARALSLAIVAAEKTYGEKLYEQYASKKAKAIIDNTEHDDWALRYFVVERLVDLYVRTDNKKYLSEAYDIALDNVNYLHDEQETLNETYLAKAKEVAIPKDLDEEDEEDKEVIDQIKAYNEVLRNVRNTEVPPVSVPLMLNCDMLFAIADELKLEASKKTRVDNLLHPNGEPLFLTEALDARYWFGDPKAKPDFDDPEFVFAGTALVMPASYLTDDYVVKVSITEPDDSKATVIKDWKVEKVERGTEGDLSTYEALLTSAKAHGQEWVPGSEIEVRVTPMEGDEESYACKYKARGTKNHWYDWLKVWEGQKNNWWDYLKVWENSVVFERVD